MTYTLWAKPRFGDTTELATYDDFAVLLSAALRRGKRKGEIAPLDHSFVTAANAVGKAVMAWQVSKDGEKVEIIFATRE